MREQMAALVDNNPPSPAGLPLVAGRETGATTAAEGQFPGNPAGFVIGRNNRNTNANNAAKGSTLAEPAAANNALRVFAAGNFNHAEVSVNGGVNWADVPVPAGPAAAPIDCCDHDVVIDDASRVTFHSTLYINSAQTTGAVRIFVRRVPPAADCSYTVEGPVANRLPDYPHLGLTKRFLYLSTNNVGSAGGFARMTRFNLDQMANCVATAFTTFSHLWILGDTGAGKTRLLHLLARLTHLGVSSVPKQLHEAGEAFGATSRQLLWKVELPYAMPTIMAGITQCIMLSLSMVVIAALVGADGLGKPVVRALNTVNISMGFEAGLAIVVLAILLDRVFKRPERRARKL